MQSGVFILMALMIGLVSAIYLPMNSSVGRFLGSPLTATITFYAVALATTIVLFAVYGDHASPGNIAKVPIYLYLTGVISAFVVFSITFLIPKIGARQGVLVSTAGQLVIAMIISHSGWLESPKDPIASSKRAGAALLMAGAYVSVN